MRHVPGRAVETLINALVKHLGDGWLLAVAIAIVAIANSGLVPKLLGERAAARERERERIAEDHRLLIEHYEAEASNQRKWRAEDAERYERKIATLEDQIGKLIEAAVLSERGNARLRHGLNNAFGYIDRLRQLYRRHGEPPPPYNGWRDMLGISADLDDRLRALFDEAGAPPPGDTC